MYYILKKKMSKSQSTAIEIHLYSYVYLFDSKSNEFARAYTISVGDLSMKLDGF